MKDTWDDYIYENTNILKNKFNIKTKEELSLKEQEILLPKLIELHLLPKIEECNKDELKKIHKYMFEDLYDFAGEYRTCTLSKNGYNFLEPELIESELEKTILEFNEELKKVKSKESFACLLATFYYELIRIHPFREGNGRSIREFIREVVILKNKEINIDVELDYRQMDRNNLMLGVQQRYFYPSMLDIEFMKGLVPMENQKKKR